MGNNELKKILCESLELERELHDFCIECLRKIYGKDADFVINEFEEGIYFRDYNGCIQSLDVLEARFINRHKSKE